MSPTIVILGGSYGGLHIAHYLLKNSKDAKVILVSKSSHLYWNIASVRLVVPGILPNEKVLAPLADALSGYAADRVELIIGSATAVDTKAKSVQVTVGSGGERTLSYDQLVLATGANCTVPRGAASEGAVMLWKVDGTYEQLAELIKTTQERVAAAKHIVVVGGGTTGIELAGELGYEFGGKPADKGGKQIVLLSSTSQLLGGDILADSARNELQKLKVDVRTGIDVVSSRTLPDGRVELSVKNADGSAAEPIVTDLYLATVGLTPNSDFLDAALLDERKNVTVDEFYHASGVATNDVWAVGDIVAKPRAGLIITQKQAAGVAKNILLTLQGKPLELVKLLPFDALVVATGRGRSVGRMGSFKIPSIMGWAAKGRTLGTQTLPSYLDGSIA